MTRSYLVFSAGGVTGWAFIGALKALEEAGRLSEFTGYAGCSIGAIIATLVSLGYRSRMLTKLFRRFEYGQLADLRLSRLLTDFGLDSGIGVIHFLEDAIQRKIGYRGLTFAQHYQITGKYLRISASCVETDSVIYYEAETHPNMKISDALRRSFSVPYLFSAVREANLTYIDGGYHQSLPVTGLPVDHTLCICINTTGAPAEPTGKTDFTIPPVILFTMRLFEGIYKYAREARYQAILAAGYKVIVIPATWETFLDFELDRAGQEELIQRGYDCVKTHIMQI